ncbi:histidine phosphatase family protein [Cryobacterium tepidiphilum]|jgi:probable phosphoglycerate mutase|uniref:Histidine phosphatase family protein n=1 Tax=Cryobacterium tepidiphilum TaxID=2486026 RepID=A0A3M8LLS4_9MICO|nr:histidine phosphatase family protein [Cryobacterium tepidiphilum]RNE66476.1 histidine phosphatase family protein [Cryobacterium tepidiphilum]
MTRFSIVRHGQTDWNREQRIQGSTDIPLNSTGRAEAAETGARLRDRVWHGVVASPLARAEETARIIAGELGLPAPRVLEGFTERRHGAIEGLTFAERQARFPDGVPVPGLETRREVLDRVLPALGELASENDGRSLLVVTHGGVIGTLIRHSTNGERPRHDELIANGSVHDFEWQGGRLVLTKFESTFRNVDEMVKR